jgi:hypothetical protein
MTYTTAPAASTITTTIATIRTLLLDFAGELLLVLG